MEHEMKLQPQCFLNVKKGTKTVESRLLDQKRKAIHVGDIIVFQEVGNLSNSLSVKVTKLAKFKNFKELINNYSMTELMDAKMSKEDYLTLLNTFYTKEEEEKFNCVAISFKLI
jgi:ASC-1-like (ASCH) protein